jgi:hypothetical protein
MDLATIYNQIYMVKPPSRFDYRWPNIESSDEISNLAVNETARALHEVSLAWSLTVEKKYYRRNWYGRDA